MSQAPDVVNWIDLRTEGVRFFLAAFPEDGEERRAVVVRRTRDLTPDEARALGEAGFVQSPNDPGILARRGGTFKMAEVRAAFPRTLPVSRPRPETRLRLDRSPFAPTPVPVPAPPSAGVTTRPPAATSPPRGLPRIAPLPGRTMVTPGSSPRAAGTPARLSGPPTTPPDIATRTSTAVTVRGRTAATAPAPPRQVSLPAGALNPFQNKYRPASKVGTPIAAVPTNLDVATRRALEDLEAAVGPVDDHVARALGWSVDRTAQALSPEQVDAVGLALYASSRGQAFVLADQTGLGKGRVLAAIARAKILAGLPVVFVTEKENLFSDFFRDVTDIGAEDAFGRPFMVNDKAQVVRHGENGTEVLHAAWKGQQVQAAIKAGEVPDGTRIVLSTYSQFNRAGSLKSEFLKSVAKGAHIILDESHNAVGDSNTSEVLAQAMDVADNVTFSSATFARNARNLSAYRRLFPVSMRHSDLMAVLSAGGQAVSEALAGMLAEDGAYLRREHDLSDIVIEVVEDGRRIERNKVYAEALWPVLAGIARMARTVSDMVDERNEDSKKTKELWSAGNFGARLSAVARQFVTCLKVEMCVDQAVELLARDVKPVVVIESTMESLMREMAADELRGEATEETAEEADHADSEGVAASSEGKRPPDFKDALRLFVERTLTLTVRRPNVDPEKVQLDDPVLLAEAAKVRELVDRFPDLPLSPIDEVRTRIEAEGRRRGKDWVAEEISARGMRVVDGAYAAMPARDRSALVAGFNSGRSDALVITRAASTGLSLHASEKVRDRRQRCMIEMQIASNVVERMQFFGRVNRRGQVSTPFFRTLSTGLPLENRLLAMQNRKMADLSANVTGSAQSSSAMDVPDMIDVVGNKVCRRILEERPSLSDRMFVAMKLPDPEKAEAELYHVNKFLSRLILLPAEEQDRLYETALQSYRTEVADLDARGGSTRGARTLEGEWKVMSSEVFEPGEVEDGQVFGRPVMLTTIEKEQEVHAVDLDEVTEMVREATARLPKHRGEVFGSEVHAIKQALPRLLQEATSNHWPYVQQAIASAQPNAVKATDRRVRALVNLVTVVRPGCQIQVSGEDGIETGLVVDVRPPPVDRAHVPSAWTVSYLVPGDERPRQISAAAIGNDPGTSVSALTPKPTETMARRFASAPRGRTKVTRKVLDGNLVRAVIASRHQGWGTPVGFADAEGVMNRAILVPRSKQSALATLPGRTVSPASAAAVLRANGDVWTNRDAPEDGAMLRREGRDVVEVTVPGRKSSLKAFETEAILAVTGPFRGTGPTKCATVRFDKAEKLLRALSESGHAFHFDGHHRKTVTAAVEAALGEREDDHFPASPRP